MTAISNSLRTIEEKARTSTQWAGRHAQAWYDPQGFEIALKSMIVGLARYGAEMRAQFGRPAGQDGYLGPALRAMAESILALLNGDIGRFDGGTLDKLIRDICTEHELELAE